MCLASQLQRFLFFPTQVAQGVSKRKKQQFDHSLKLTVYVLISIAVAAAATINVEVISLSF